MDDERVRLAELCRRFRIDTVAAAAYVRHHDQDQAEALAFRDRLAALGVRVSLETARLAMAQSERKEAADAYNG